MNNDKIKLVFATNNAHKLRELREILGTGYELLSLADIGCHEDIPEDGATLEENSLAKAQYVFDHYGYDCFADDTGLEVTALDGRPGVYSARYAGEDCDSERNIDKLLGELADKTDRTARFRTVIALIEGSEGIEFEGKIEGTIATERHGEGGFGYDKVFLPEGSDRTFAEMKSAEKNAISHRARATKKLIDYLKKTL